MCKLFIKADPTLWESHTRSLRIDGMVTSVRLENFFWTTLDEISRRDGMNSAQLIAKLYNESIDAGHDLGNFTSFYESAAGVIWPCSFPAIFRRAATFRLLRWMQTAFSTRKR